MKKILPFLFMLTALSVLKASDTLTVRQVFNFNVGDTFDYKWVSNLPSVGLYQSGYIRKVLTQINYSTAQDTLFFTFNLPIGGTMEIDTITNLDSIAIFSLLCTPNIDTTGCNPPFSYTSTVYFGYQSDSIVAGCFENFSYYCYTNSLGRTYYNWKSYVGGNDYVWDSYTYQLIYFANDSISIGTSYEILSGQALVHFTPIPEQCATWTKKVDHNPPLWGSYYEQIRTDSIVSFNNHNYVRLLFRSADTYYNTFTPDSFIGYFRNDSIGKKVWFTPSQSTQETILYNFNLNDDSAIDGNNVNLSAVSISGQPRTLWSYSHIVDDPITSHFPYDTVIDRSYIEGIGGLQGFVKVNDELHSDTIFDNNLVIATNVQFDEGTLISFCVCGNPIYPDTSTTVCQLLTGISTINLNQAIRLYPNPTTDLLHLSITNEDLSNTQFIITDILGQEVYSSSIAQSETTHDISGLSSGIYTWRISPQTPEGGLNTNSNGSITTGKVIKE